MQAPGHDQLTRHAGARPGTAAADVPALFAFSWRPGAAPGGTAGARKRGLARP
jgi:hypothetical protein